ncbi:MAG: sugar phosphate isomerase/epimerase [Clostridiales bacterium]|jgi:fatty-acyl-CoA synthase|nr:sugar phosphate isomerase/epimerase [Clostridiales bacterium]
MKLSFSTLACPNWTFGEITSAAKDLGYDGIEIRGMGDELYAPKLKIFDDAHLTETRSKLDALGLSLPILSSGATLGVYSKKDDAIKESSDYIALAQKLGVPYIRVLITADAFPNGGDTELFRKSYLTVCREGERAGVTPLVETNGLFADTTLLKKVFESIDSENKGILWDVNHTFRYNSEPVAETLKNIGAYIRHVHIKDSLIEKGKPSYKLLGYGDIPVKTAVQKLNASGYMGYYSLEWVKRWQSDLEAEGIVFAHTIKYLKELTT